MNDKPNAFEAGLAFGLHFGHRHAMRILEPDAALVHAAHQLHDAAAEFIGYRVEKRTELRCLKAVVDCAIVLDEHGEDAPGYRMVVDACHDFMNAIGEPPPAQSVNDGGVIGACVSAALQVLESAESTPPKPAEPRRLS